MRSNNSCLRRIQRREARLRYLLERVAEVLLAHLQLHTRIHELAVCSSVPPFSRTITHRRQEVLADQLVQRALAARQRVAVHRRHGRDRRVVAHVHAAPRLLQAVGHQVTHVPAPLRVAAMPLHRTAARHTHHHSSQDVIVLGIGR